MNEMYNMGIVTHYYSVWAVFGVILLNLFMLNKADDVQKYRRFNTLFMPIGSMFIGGVIFTGVIMMAAKHLDFTIENILMIVIGIYIIVLEAKRSKKLRFIKNDDLQTFVLYQAEVKKLLLLELLLLVLISAWMLI